jgi:DNA polymerase-3 subunit beta
MDIEVKTDQFKKVVSCASRATSNKAIQPILNNILLSSGKGFLMVSATDLDLAIECKLPAEISKPGRITLPAKKLDEIVSKASGINVNISIDKNQLANILSDKAKFQINGVNTDEFPEIINKKGEENCIKIGQKELLQAISLTSFAISKFESTSILSGANFEVNGNKFEVGATDGSRLARYIGNLPDNKLDKNQKISAVIPGRALAELERLIDTFKDGNEFVSVYFLPGQIIFQNSDFSLSTRLLNGTFPEYDKLIPKEQSNKAIFSTSELLSALERVAILANERTNVIRLNFEKGKKTTRLNSNSPDYGNATDEIEVEFTGNSMEIAFNYRYLTEALRNLKTDKVLIEMETSLSPLLLRLSEKAEYNYTYLIMPVQLR